MRELVINDSGNGASYWPGEIPPQLWCLCRHAVRASGLHDHVLSQGLRNRYPLSRANTGVAFEEAENCNQAVIDVAGVVDEASSIEVDCVDEVACVSMPNDIDTSCHRMHKGIPISVP